MNKSKKYHVALSFAGENRSYVDKVAETLRRSNVSVFYDNFEEHNLWGKDLYSYLIDIYRDQSHYTVMFISKFYIAKRWTKHEMRAAQERAFNDVKEYILPARFDDTPVPSLLSTVGYIDISSKSPEELVEIIKNKLSSDGLLKANDNVNDNYDSSVVSGGNPHGKFLLHPNGELICSGAVLCHNDKMINVHFPFVFSDIPMLELRGDIGFIMSKIVDTTGFKLKFLPNSENTQINISYVAKGRFEK